MIIEKHLKRWVDANLIQQSQADAIVNFEKERPSASWVLYGIAGLGVVVLLTGVISIIAANWDLISPMTKLVAYFVSLAALGYFAWKRSPTEGVVRESLLLAFSVYLLAGIGLVGQTYHLESDGYSAIFFWLTMTLPVTLLAQSRLVNHLWFMGLTAGVLSWIASNTFRFNEQEILDKAFVTMAIPYVLLAVGYGLGHVLSKQFADAARLWAYVCILLPIAIMANVVWEVGDDLSRYQDFGPRPWIPTLALVLAITAVCVRRIQPGKHLTYAICATLLLSGVLIITPTTMPLGRHSILGCALFIAVWAGAAAIAAANERRRLFDFCALVIGIRFIVVYFQVFGSLAATGIGLIISGSVILGVAYVWHRYRGSVAKAIQEHL